MTTTVGVTRVIEIDVKASANAAAHLKQIQQQLGGLENTAKNTQSSMGRFFDNVMGGAKAMVGFFAGNLAWQAVAFLRDMSDQATVLKERFRLVTGSADGMRTALDEITRISVAQGREMEGVAKLYEKITRQQEQLGLTTKGVSVLTEGFAASLRLSGAQTNEANAAMLQFAQGLASGKIAGDEFRSMMENNPVFMYELAKAAGVSVGALKDMSKEGEINLKLLRESLFKTGEDGKNALQRMIDQAENLPKTFAQAVSGLRAQFIDLLGALGQTAQHSEGIFTRMLKNIQKAMSTATQFIKDEAEVQKQLNELRGEAWKNTPEGKLDPMGQSNLKMRNEQEGFRQQIENAHNALKKMGERNEANAKQWDRQIGLIKQYYNEIEARERVIQKNIERREKMGSDQPLLTPTYGASSSGDSKKGKGPKAKDLDDPLGEMLDKLYKAERTLDAKADGIGKYRQEVEELALKVADGTPKVKEFLDILRGRADKLDAREEEADMIKKKREAVVREVEEYMKELQSVGKEVEKIFNQYSEETGEKLSSWGKRLNDLTDFMKKSADKLSPEDLAKLNKVLDFLRGKVANEPWEKEKKEIVDLFREDKGLEGTEWLTEAEEQLQGTFDRMIDSMLEFNKTGKEIIRDFVEDFLKQMARIAMQRTMQPFAEMAVEGAMRFLTGMMAADGAAFGHGGVRLFGKGDVVNQPTGFTYNGGNNAGVMGEAGPEAIMPLRRGPDGKLGVGATPVTVNVINNAPNTRATAHEQTGSDGQREIVVFVEEIVEGALGSGRYDKVLRNAFDVTRKGKG